MTVVELEGACVEAIRTGTGLTLTLDREPHGERIRLVPHWDGGGCPLGEVLQVRDDGSTVARFDPAEILRFLTANATPVR